MIPPKGIFSNKFERKWLLSLTLVQSWFVAGLCNKVADYLAVMVLMGCRMVHRSSGARLPTL